MAFNKRFWFLNSNSHFHNILLNMFLVVVFPLVTNIALGTGKGPFIIMNISDVSNDFPWSIKIGSTDSTLQLLAPFAFLLVNLINKPINYD